MIKQKRLYRVALILSVVCVGYQLEQVAMEIPHMLSALQQHPTPVQMVLSVGLALAHLLVAALLLVTAYGFWRHRANEHWLGVVALVKVVSFILELLSYHDGTAGQVTEVVCCALLGLYALCCFGVVHRPTLLVPLETALLIIGYGSSLYVVIQHVVFTAHAPIWEVLLAAVCDPLSTLVMLLLALGCHIRE